MDEILYELSDYIVGLNCGRWDYIFSFIKKFSRRPGVRAAGPAAGDDDDAFPALVLEAADQDLPSPRRLRDGRHGGADSDQERSGGERGALAKVRADKEREAGDGHDGTWVAHPGLVPVAMEIFDRLMPTPNQLHRKLEDVEVTRGRPARSSRRARSPRPACATTSTCRSSTSRLARRQSAACRSTT